MAGGNFAGGDGSVSNPFLIEDAHDFNALRFHADNSYRFQLVRDINLNVPPYNQGSGWQPIPLFNGHIDGQGHKVSGLRIWSKGEPVGLFLRAVTGSMTNIHFDDFYLEMITENTAIKHFTFTGYELENSSSLNRTRLQGCSLVGEVRINAPNDNFSICGFFTERTIRPASGGNETPLSQSFQDLLIDIRNTGEYAIPLNGRISGFVSNRRAGVSFERCILKLTGAFEWARDPGSSQANISGNNYFINGYDRFIYTGFSTVPEKFLSNPENLPGFVDATHSGRQAWYFPGTTHVRMVDYSRNKFLIEANNKIFSCDTNGDLIHVGNAPIIADMFTKHGMSYIESVSTNTWNQLRQDYGNVEIHCHIEKMPGKSLVLNKEKLLFDQALDDRAVMRSVIDFSKHNSDVHKIAIPKVGSEEEGI